MKKINTLTSILLAVSLSVSAGLALAQSNPLTSKMDAYTIKIDKKGKETAIQSAEISPNQLIEYRLTYENVSKGALKGLRIVAPIPAGTSYKGKSNKTKVATTFMVSIDNGKTFEKEPVKRMVKDASGKMVEKIIPVSKYTHVRWLPTAAIKAGEKQLYNYRVQVK